MAQETQPPVEQTPETPQALVGQAQDAIANSKPMSEHLQDAGSPAADTIFHQLDAAFADSVSNVYLQGFLLVFLSIVVGKFADWVLSVYLKRLAQRTQSTVDDRLIALLHGPVVKTVVLGGIDLAYERIDPANASLIRHVLLTMLLVMWAAFAFRASAVLLRSASRRPDVPFVEERTFPLFDNLSKTLIFALALWGLISIWNISAAPWLASAGVAGIAIGFAAQDTLSNFFAGVFIIADAPYRVGDYVNLDNGQRGKVARIGLRSTRILTRDDIEITIPNAIIGNAPIVNESAGPYLAHRIRAQVGVAYGTDLARMTEILLAVATEHEDVCKTPEPRVRFREFGDSGLLHELLCWIPHPELRGKVLHELNTSIHNQLAEAGIEIPFPKRDLYIKQLPDGLLPS